MSRLATIFFGLLALFLVLFLVAEALHVPMLTEVGPWLEEPGVATAAVSLLLLVGDVFLPVPSSVIMTANGSLFGLIGGTLLSLLGGMGAAALAFAIGRRGGKLVNRSMSEKDRDRAQRLLARWGVVTVIATRPIPLLAEAVAIMAGTTAMGWRPFLLASAAGLLPGAALYAWAGSSELAAVYGLWVFAGVLLLAGAFWLIGKSGNRRRDHEQ